MSSTIPDSHRDLLDGPVIAALATLMPDGTMQVTPVVVRIQADSENGDPLKGIAPMFACPLVAIAHESAFPETPPATNDAPPASVPS